MSKSKHSKTTLRTGENWRLFEGDCITHMADVAATGEQFDMSIFSPPFPALYAYTDSPSDIGNSDDLNHETKLHLSFFYRQLARVIKPGRAIIVHVCQIPRMKRSGGVGLFDFRGLNIRIGERAGLVYEYDWLVRKNPQSQAIRSRSRELQFAGLEADRAKSRGAIPDYLIKFRTKGDNESRVNDKGEVSRNDWIDWAEPAWLDIRETDTLNVHGTKGDGDTKHICPLQLGVIDRCVRLFSARGETVFSPFAGIGSEGYVALKNERKFYGCELKKEYVEAAVGNLDLANKRAAEETKSLFETAVA